MVLATQLSILYILGLSLVAQGQTPCLEKYRESYVPHFVYLGSRLHLVAPDTPYVAKSGPNKLYFLDTRQSPETAQHTKDQIEWAMVGSPDTHIFIDEIEATARVRDSANNTLFVFDPWYARVLFARGMNRRNPSLQLPEYGPPGDWERSYDIGATLY